MVAFSLKLKEWTRMLGQERGNGPLSFPLSGENKDNQKPTNVTSVVGGSKNKLRCSVVP